ncbi:MAG: Lar family restriction alleviation protein [Dehalococcoidia bacterium]|jgi:hypothetical protein
MSDELKACPHCGGSNILLHEIESHTFCYQCDDCDYSPDWWLDTEAEAAQYWNTRPIEDGMRSQLDAMREHYHQMSHELTEVTADCNRLRAELANRYVDIYALRAELATSQAEVERLRGIISKAEFINGEFHGDGVLCDKCAICDGYAMEGHTEDCPFYQWEGGAQ